MADEVRTFWDAQAATFDAEPDHGLRDPETSSAWRDVLLARLPVPPADVLDVGCGTGTLSVLLAQEGFRVRGVDLSPAMVALASAKAAAARRPEGLDVTFAEGDASAPPAGPGSYDVVLTRHVLWALPDPRAALESWTRLLRANGRLVLVEGFWHTGSGLSAADCEALLRSIGRDVEVAALRDPALWGADIGDERYVALSLR